MRAGPALGFLLPILCGGNDFVFLDPLPGVLLFAIVSVFVVAGAALAGSSAARPVAPILCLAAFLAWWVACLLFRAAGPRAGLETIALLCAALLHVALLWQPPGAADFRGFVAGLLVGVLVTAAYGQYQWWYAFPRIAPILRDLGPGLVTSVNANFYNANAYGAFLAATTALGVGSILALEPGKARAARVVATALIFATLLFSQSRSALALLLAALSIPFLRRALARPSLVLLGIAALSCAAWVGSGWIEPAELWNAGTLGRVAIWLGALHMIADHWLLGVGIGGFAEAFPRYQVTTYFTRYPHSFPLEVWAESGILGLVPLLGFLALSVGAAIRHPKPPGSVDGRFIFAAMGILLVHGALDIDWHAPANVILLFFLLGAARAEPRLDEG